MTDLNHTARAYIAAEAHAQRTARTLLPLTLTALDRPDTDQARAELHASPEWIANRTAWTEVEALEGALIAWAMTKPAGFYFHGMAALTAHRDTEAARTARLRCLQQIKHRTTKRGSLT